MMSDDEVLSAAKKLVNDAKRNMLFELSHELITEHNFKTIPGKKVDKVYHFKDGYYQENGEVIIKQQTEEQLKKNATIGTVNEIIGRIKRLTFVKTEFFDTPPEIINMVNGYFNIKTDELLPHSKEIPFLYIIPVTYDPNKECPKIMKFMNETLDKDDVELLQEYIGFCIYKRYVFKKAMIFVGEKDTGKTTILNLIIKFLGEKNISGESLQKIVRGRFNSANLRNKLANIYDDLPYADITNAGDFKIATGGGYITAEEKFGETYQFINAAKLIYACNQIPKLKDSSDSAYFDRWLVIRFNNTVEKKDPFIIDKLTTPEELSGMLNWVLVGLERIFSNGQFTYNVTEEQNKLIILRNSEPLAAFIEDCMVQADGKHIPTDLLYRLYCYHAKINKLEILTKTMLTQRLPPLAPYVSRGQRNVEKKKTECYINTVGKNYQDFIITLGVKSGIYRGVYIISSESSYGMCEFCKTRERTSEDSSACQQCFDNMPEKPGGQERLDV